MSRRGRASFSRLLLPAMILAMAGTFVPPAHAAVCSVPGTHATIEDAVWAPNCTEINLANQLYQESVIIWWGLTMSGPPGGTATIEGLVEVIGDGNMVGLKEMTIQNGCSPNTLLVAEGAGIDGFKFVVPADGGLPCPPSPVTDLFDDGFEGGNTSAWSGVSP